jgi:hypothetical protein
VELTLNYDDRGAVFAVAAEVREAVEQLPVTSPECHAGDAGHIAGCKEIRTREAETNDGKENADFELPHVVLLLSIWTEKLRNDIPADGRESILQ